MIGKPEWSQRLLRFLYLKIKREGNDASMMQWCVIINKTIITGFGGSFYERG